MGISQILSPSAPTTATTYRASVTMKYKVSGGTGYFGPRSLVVIGYP